MSFSVSRVLLPALVAGLLLPAPMASQLRMDHPRATFQRGFGSIESVRELRDGRVLTVDPSTRTLLALDFGAGTVEVVGGEGTGEQQYRDPDAVWPLPGDSTLLVDLGNGRLTVVAPDLTFRRSVPIHQGGSVMAGTPLLLAVPGGVDSAGRVYIAQEGGGPDQGSIPSALILRFPPEGGVPDTLGTVRMPERNVIVEGGLRRTSPVPFSPEDAWGVAPDGSLVIARVGDYHLEWVAPDGAVQSGPPIPFTPVPVGSQEREAFLSGEEIGAGELMVMAQMLNGKLTLGFSRNRDPQAPEVSPTDWPRVMPPFRGGSIPVDLQGRGWVRRRTPAGAPVTYDLFDREGTRVGTVELTGDRRLVGFGPAGVYLSAGGQDGLRHLELHDLPVSSESSLPDTPAGRRLTSWLQLQGHPDDHALAELFTADAPRPAQEAILGPGGWSLETDGPLEEVEILASEPTRLSAVGISRRTQRWFRLGLSVEPTSPWRVEELTLAAGDPPDAVLRRPLDDEGLAREMDEYLRVLDAAGAFSGTALVARGDSVLFLEAVGMADRAAGLPNGPDTRYALGSLNKIWTAVAVLHLVESGRLELDAPVGRYLPDYPSARVREEVRLRHLLTHTGGMGDFVGMEFFRARGTLRSVSNYLSLFSQRDPQFFPGTQASYSNAGYILLGAVVEAVTGETYYDYLRKAVYGPAGMTASGFDLASDREAGTAVGYTRMAMGAPGEVGPDGRIENLGSIPLRGSPAGGGYSTVSDLLRFTRALTGGRLLAPDMTGLLLAPTERSPSGNLMAYGARVFQSDGVFWSGHGGGSGGMNAELQIDAEGGYTIVILSNFDPDAAGMVAQKARELVARRRG